MPVRTTSKRVQWCEVQPGNMRRWIAISEQNAEKPPWAECPPSAPPPPGPCATCDEYMIAAISDTNKVSWKQLTYGDPAYHECMWYPDNFTGGEPPDYGRWQPYEVIQCSDGEWSLALAYFRLVGGEMAWQCTCYYKTWAMGEGDSPADKAFWPTAAEGNCSPDGSILCPKQVSVTGSSTPLPP